MGGVLFTFPQLRGGREEARGGGGGGVRGLCLFFV